MAADSFIPNSFQTPNAYVDRLMALLTSDEYKVLSYAARRIFGFQKRADRISLSQFAGGIVTRAGERLDYGTGLSIGTTRAAVHALITYGVLLELAPNDSHVNAGPLYTLQLDAARVDYAGLEARRADQQAHNAARARTARQGKTRSVAEAAPPVVGHTPLCETTGGMSTDPLLCDNSPPLLCDNTTPPVVAQTPPPVVAQQHNNQGNPEENQWGNGAPPPAADPFDELTSARAARQERATLAARAPRPIRCPRLEECPPAFQQEVAGLLAVNPHITADHVSRALSWFRQDMRREVRLLSEWLPALRDVVLDEIDKWRPTTAPRKAARPGGEIPIVKNWN